jgi:hypothetical protein
MCLVLPWFVVCFWTLWCDTGGCEQQGEYKRVSSRQLQAGSRSTRV